MEKFNQVLNEINRDEEKAAEKAEARKKKITPNPAIAEAAAAEEKFQ